MPASLPSSSVDVNAPNAAAAHGVDGIELQNLVEPARIGQLLDLYAATWWAVDRTGPDVKKMLAASDLIFALIDRATDRLVGFARVLLATPHRSRNEVVGFEGS